MIEQRGDPTSPGIHKKMTKSQADKEE